MAAQIANQMTSATRTCPECGAQEDGFFCRSCGALVHGPDRVLCPRCHHVVPGGDFCNQCGQELTGIALRLDHLAQAGEAFWMTPNASELPASPESALLRPDDSVELTVTKLPGWIQELAPEPEANNTKERIHPSLQPLQSGPLTSRRRGQFLIVVILLTGIMLASLIVLTLFILAQST